MQSRTEIVAATVHFGLSGLLVAGSAALLWSILENRDV